MFGFPMGSRTCLGWGLSGGTPDKTCGTRVLPKTVRAAGESASVSVRVSDGFRLRNGTQRKQPARGQVSAGRGRLRSGEKWSGLKRTESRCWLNLRRQSARLAPVSAEAQTRRNEHRSRSADLCAKPGSLTAAVVQGCCRCCRRDETRYGQPRIITRSRAGAWHEVQVAALDRHPTRPPEGGTPNHRRARSETVNWRERSDRLTEER